MDLFKRMDRGLLVFLSLGLLQGLTLFRLIEIDPDPDDWLTRDYATFLFTVFMPTAFFLSATRATRLPSLIFAVCFGFIAAGLHIWAVSLSGNIGDNEVTRITAFFGGAGMGYILVCFFRAAAEDGCLTDYPALFKHAWNLPFVAGLAGIFLGAFWLLLFLWAALFNLINIDFFEDLFTEEAFAWPASCATLAVGTYIARDWERVILTLRGVAITLLRFLSPILAFASLLFLMALIGTGLTPLWEATSATVTTISLVVFALLLINAVIGDGHYETENANALLSLVGRAQSILLPAFAGIAVYSLWLRADQYGWTVARIYGALFVAVGTLYALAYLAAAVTPVWKTLTQKANIAIALLSCGLVVLVQSPLLNPFAISTNNLVHRLDTGRTPASEFDFGYLHFKLGDPGKAALKSLRTDTGREDHAQITARLEELARFDTYWEWERYLRDGLPREGKTVEEMIGNEIRLRPVGIELDPTFVDTIKDHTLEWDNCKGTQEEGRPCYILAVDIVADETLEYVWFTYNAEHKNFIIRPYHLNPRNQTWEAFGTHHGYDRNEPSDKIWQALEDGEFGTFDLRYRGLSVGGEDFILNFWNLQDLKPPPAPGEDEGGQP